MKFVGCRDSWIDFQNERFVVANNEVNSEHTFHSLVLYDDVSDILNPLTQSEVWDDGASVSTELKSGSIEFGKTDKLN